MPGAGDALRGRTFGIPNLALLAAVAAGIWWFFLRKPAGATTPNAAAAGSQLQSGYGLGFAQGQQAAQATQAPAATPAAVASRPAWQFGPNPSSPYVWRTTQQGQAAASARGIQFPAQVMPGPLTQDILQLTGPYGTQWAIAPQGTDPAAYAQQLNESGAGVGGPIRKHAIGSRSAWLHHDAHPLIGSKVNYAHFVRVGGPRTAAAHQHNVNRVAQQAGVHPARVAMLNPVPTGLIRIA